MQCTENKVLHVFLEDENETFESRNPATPQFLHVQQTNQVHNDRKRSLFDGDLGFSFIISRIFGLQHRISKHLLVARFVPFKTNPTRVDDRDDDHTDHKIHSLN